MRTHIYPAGVEDGEVALDVAVAGAGVCAAHLRAALPELLAADVCVCVCVGVCVCVCMYVYI